MKSRVRFLFFFFFPSVGTSLARKHSRFLGKNWQAGTSEWSRSAQYPFIYSSES